MSNKVKTRLMIAGAALCAALFLFSGAMLCREYLDQKQSAEAFDEVAGLVKEDVELPTLELADDPAQEPEELTAFDKYADVYAQNSDLVGWISIPGTRIDYPVMQTKDNPNFYLKHAFDKSYSSYGVPYMQENCDIGISDNLVLYGHHMNNGSIFSDLCKYESEDFYQEHKTIRFDTLDSFGEYEVIAAFKTVAYSEEGFKQILWSKRCKDKSLVGTVKETIMQVSSSKKWLSKPALDEQGAPVLQKNGKPVLRKSYSVLQDDFFQAMRNAGYTDVERGERGSSEEHLTVTQFKVEREQERLEQLTAQTQQKEQQAASLEKKIEKIQKQQIAVQEVEQIEPHAVPFSSKVMLDRPEYENLAAAAKKFYVQERKESKLQKALNAAIKMINALKAELAEYKSVRGQLRTLDLEKENDNLRNKLRSYETVISRNNLWSYFARYREKGPSQENFR